MKKINFLLILSLLVLCKSGVQAQTSTYALVYQLIETHCAGASCHDGTVPTFNINVSADSFYNEVINLTPVNPYAAGTFNKIVAPGDVQHSFLLRKIAHGISDGLALHYPYEGADMPSGLPALANNEIELVRQWILYGAPDTGVVIDTGLINSYYRTGGIDDTYSPHAAPDSGTGFQIYYGRVFLGANTRDTEVFYKVNPHFANAIECQQLTTMLPANDHHFQILLFSGNGQNSYPWGIRPLSESSMEVDEYGIGTAAGLWNYTLPTGTAFYFPAQQWFDLDLHIQNPSLDSIYSTDIYVNFYTEPAGTAQHYMLDNNWPNFNIPTPEDSLPHTFTVNVTDSTQSTYWNIWKLYTHTHKYGTAFNVFLMNPDGSWGAQIYNGDYSYEEGFDVGYYRWGPHVTIETWPGDSLFVVNPLVGMVGQATFVNTAGPNPVNWGFSAADEMMVVGFMYVQGAPLETTAITPTGPQEPVATKVFPNPLADQFVLQYDLPQPSSVVVDVTDMMGNKVANLVNENDAETGKYTHGFQASDYKMAPGMYLVSFNINGNVQTQKLIVTE